jgi:hypothetical protein
MPRNKAHSSGFTWTTEEISTKTGITLGPANANPDSEELAYLVVRVDDERSSDLCKEIERMSRTNGGIVFRNGESEALSRGMGGGTHTHLFHDNCRCRLVLKPQAMYGAIDELDFSMAVGPSALNHTQQMRAQKKLEAPVLQRAKAFEYRAQIQRIVSNNLSNKNPIWNFFRGLWDSVSSRFSRLFN